MPLNCWRRSVSNACCFVSTRIPGFTLILGTSLLFICLILLLPLSALVMQLSQMNWAQYWDVVTNPQVVSGL